MSHALALGCCLGVSLASTELNFLVMGDWGGADHKPYTTKPQVDMAESMNDAAKRLDAKFALALGDNFYHYGVKSVADERFQTTFEQCFSGEALQESNDFTFHVIAGNHDHRGSVQAQIDYSKKSKRWSFPANYYSFRKTAPDGATIDFVMIDTILLAGNSQMNNVNGTWISMPGSLLPGPDSDEQAQTQMDWIRDTIVRSTADYLIVAGHYPVHSVAEHGPSHPLQADSFPFLRDYRVSAYICGHDHDAQHIDVGDGVQYHVVGSSHGGQSLWWHMHSVEKDQLKFKTSADGGFALVSASKKGLVIRHANGKGDILYQAPPIPSRHSQPPKPLGRWDCRSNMKVKKLGKDKNLLIRVNILDCQSQCRKRENCKAIRWHRWDRHCHLYVGDFTHADFKRKLEPTKHRHDSCFYTPPAAAQLIV